MKRTSYLLTFIFVIMCMGCVVEQSVAPDKKLDVPDETVEFTAELEEVHVAFNAIESNRDRLTIHKLFSGSAEYLSVCDTLDSTSQFDPLLGKVQSSYGWNREKYTNLTDAVSDYLRSVDYDKPKKLSSRSDRQEFAEIFKDLAEATKHE